MLVGEALVRDGDPEGAVRAMTAGRPHEHERARRRPRGTPTSRAGSAARFGGRVHARGAGRGARRADRRLAGGDGRPGVHRRVRRPSCREYAGLPSPLYEASRLSEQVGARILLKREDLNHTGAHKIRNVLGQALLTKRMGKTRVIAETGAGQHGVASATAAAYFGLDCTVYMGAVDIKRQALNVARMQLLGTKVIPVDSGSATLKDAINEALRDWVASRRPHGLPLRDGGRPAPLPEHGPRLHPRHRRRGAGPVPRAVRRAARRGIAACVGGGSNAIGLFTAFLDDGRRDPRLRAGRRRLRHRRGTPPRSTPATRACCTAPAPTCSRTRTARPSSPTRSRPGSTTPGVGPQHAHLAASGRASYSPVTDAEAMDAMALLSRTEGIIPAIESAHAIAGALEVAEAASAPTTHADQPLRPRRQGHGHRASTGSTSATPRVAREPVDERLASAFEKARAEGRAALVGYLPAGFPDVAGGIDALRAMVDAGCDVIEIGLPYSDPVMDGPTIQAAAQRALEGGVRTRDVLAHRRGGRRHRHPDGGHDLLEPRRALRRRAVRRRPRLGRGSGPDHPRPDPRLRAPRGSPRPTPHDLDKVFLVAPSSTDERIAMTTAACRGFVYATAVMGVTGARTTTSDLAGPLVARTRARPPTCRSGVGLGVSNGDQAAEVASYADGVIVGSRVRARACSTTPTTGRRAARAGRADRATSPRGPPCARTLRRTVAGRAARRGAGAGRVRRRRAGEHAHRRRARPSRTTSRPRR